MDERAGDLTLDANGVCNYCHSYVEREGVRKLAVTELPWILHKIKKDGVGKPYDVILGLSGGVDSSMCLHWLKQHGIRPLCFSVDNGWNTPEADLNIMNLVETAKVRFHRYTIDRERFYELQRALYLAGIKNLEAATDHTLMAATYEMAHEYGIKWIISGGNLATESSMPTAWGHNARDLGLLKSVYRQFIGKPLRGLPTISLPQYLKCRFIDGVKIVNLLDYTDYNKEAAKSVLRETYGWKDYGEKHGESLFTKWFQNMYLPRTFGIDKRVAHLASLVMSRQLPRDAALRELSVPPAFVDSAPIFERLKIDMSSTLPERHSHLDYPNSERWWDRLSKLYTLWK